MVCLKETTLHLYLDGELEPGFRERIAAHIEACSRCQALAWQRMSLDLAVTAVAGLFHDDQPHLGAEQLAAYVAGDLDGAAHERAESHLAACGSCRSAWIQSAELASPPRPVRVKKSARRAPRRRRCLRRRLHRKR